MSLKFNHYLNLNREGIFPGPRETEEEFAVRTEKIRAEISLPGIPLTQKEWEEAHRITKPVFDIQPTWIPAFYRDQKLSFWEAAATWDFEGRTVVQLAQKKKGRFILVNWEEVLAHEAAHAARMAFRESRFEEILSYQTSRSSWRKRFGPLFRHPWEAALCAGAAGIGWVFGMFGMLTPALIVPWIPFLFFFVRLQNDRTIFKRCQKKLKPLLLHPEQTLAAALRLTDREIVFFAKASQEEIIDYIRRAKEEELRWKVISSSYFSV